MHNQRHRHDVYCNQCSHVFFVTQSTRTLELANMQTAIAAKRICKLHYQVIIAAQSASILYSLADRHKQLFSYPPNIVNINNYVCKCMYLISTTICDDAFIHTADGNSKLSEGSMYVRQQRNRTRVFLTESLMHVHLRHCAPRSN